MSDRPEDHTDPEHGGPAAPGAPGWPTEPMAPGSPTEPMAPGWPAAGPAEPPGATASPEVPWWQQPHAEGPGAGQPHAGASGAEEAAPASASGAEDAAPAAGHAGGASNPYGSPGYGPGGMGAGAPGAPGGPEDWHGGHWQGGHWQGGPWQGGPWQGGPWGWTPAGGWGPPARPGGGRGRKVAAAVAAAGLTALALLVGIGIGYGVWNGGSSGTPTSGRFIVPGGGTQKATATATGRSTSGRTSSTGKISSATGAPTNIATISSKVTPGLVDIDTVLGYETDEAAGTGMVLTPTGKVLTNNHVIEGSTKITVTDLGNGKVYSASVLGYTRTQDVAVIQLKGASGLKTVKLGNSSTVKVGQSIVGIGNAGGTGGRPSAAGGSVTALNQAITASDQGSLGTTTEHLTGLVETNANIQPGDSGGPLVTTNGAVVGMDTAASAAQGYSLRGATGQGYSIPINEAISLAHQIIAGKSSATVHIGETPFLGVYVESPTAHTPSSGFGFGTPTTTVTPASTSGAVIANVIPGTPAQTSGLARGDVITNVAGTPVTSPSGLTKIMLKYHPGDSVKVVWTTRSGQTASGSVTLANGPAD